MSRLIWIPAVLLGLGAGAIALVSHRRGAEPEVCTACETLVNDRDLRRVPAVTPDGVRSSEPMVNKVACGGSRTGLADDDVPDFTGIGIELVRTRQLLKLPPPMTKVTPEELRRHIAQQLAAVFPPDYGKRQGRALAALGAVPAAVDTLEQQAVFWAQHLGAWYDAEEEALLVSHVDESVPQAENALGLAFAFLLREHGECLRKDAAAPTTDAWLARVSLLAGDASLTCRIQAALAKPKSGGPPRTLEVQPVVLPLPQRDFLQDLEISCFSAGRNFTEALHHLGEFDQVNAAYERPPEATAELLDAGLYFADEQFEPKSPAWPDLKVLGREPFWDDSLGALGTAQLLWQRLPQDLAEAAVTGWSGDRWLAYEGKGDGRGSVAWQTLWKDKAAADQFFSAMQRYVHEKYPGTEPVALGEGAWRWNDASRNVILTRTHYGTGVLYADAADAPFVEALRKKFAAP